MASNTLTPLTITNFLTGQTGTYNFAAQNLNTGGAPSILPRGILRFHNPSGLVLQIVMQVSGDQFNLMANGQVDYRTVITETGFTYTVLSNQMAALNTTIYLTYYPPGNAPEQHGTIANGQGGQGNQPRIIAVPVTPDLCDTGSITLAVGASSGNLITAQNVAVPPLSVGNTVRAYLYYFYANPGSGTVWSAWLINIVCLSGGGAVLSTTLMHQFILAGSISATPQQAEHTFNPPYPHSKSLVIPNLTTAINIRATLNSSNGSASANMYYTVGIGVDLLNGGENTGSIGNVAAYLTTGGPTF